ncbi:MAG: tetratricopeptide repeat protein [Melioribacteraceae bacterium]|nr:tetratricopeptide repeat protein [Melioribacteraceae bacterium]
MSKVRKSINNSHNNSTKTISAVRQVYLILFLLIAGMFILYSSGSLEGIPAGHVHTGNSGFMDDPTNPHSGADLNQLQKIRDLEEKVAAANDLNLLLDLGHLYNDSGFYQKAIDTYKKYLSQNNNNADVLVDMGVCYFNMKNYDEAIDVMQRALKFKPDHQIAKFNLGIVYFSSGDMETAKDWWKEAVEIDPLSEIAIKAKSLLESH